LGQYQKLILKCKKKDFERAMEIFKQYHDKDFSFVDCMSFAIMNQQNLFQAFTFDQHFAQAGFEKLDPNLTSSVSPGFSLSLSDEKAIVR